jgi:hypothetical protein
MIIRFATVLSLVASLTLSAPLWAKGDMVLVKITGATLKSPIEITDSKIQEFNIWAGPGVTSAQGGVQREDTEGFIIDWQAGVAAQRPNGLQHYEVSFYAGCRTGPNSDCGGEKPRLAYVVSYDYAPAAKRGFVYLPRKGDPSYYINIGSVGHNGREGNWFLAKASWEDFVRPLIAKAQDH